MTKQRGGAGAETAVLVTRPAAQAEPLCKLLAARGFRPVRFPLLEIHGLKKLPTRVRRLIAQLDQFQALIFISANAVQQGLRCFESTWPQLPKEPPRWFAVGASSAALLAERGLNPRYPPTDMSSEGLLALPELAQVRAWRILIVKGRGGRGYLRRQLERRGAKVKELALYERKPTSAAARASRESARTAASGRPARPMRISRLASPMGCSPSLRDRGLQRWGERTPGARLPCRPPVAHNIL